MARSPRGSGPPRRPRVEARTPRETAGSRSPEAPARTLDAQRIEAAAPRFQIFIVDPGWNSPAHRVLRENFGMLCNLAKGDAIYVLSREKSIAFTLSQPSLIGKGPAIIVHDLAALREGGATGFHGFRLHLGLLRTEEQALLALQSFTRFLATHRQSVDLEAEIRTDLRREGLAGAIEIILHHEPRDIGA
jgi:hypothetical protein